MSTIKRTFASATAAALLAAGLAAAGPTASGAVADGDVLTANDASSWAAAIEAAVENPGPDTISITADFAAPGMSLTYDVDQDLTIDGQGHTVTWDGTDRGSFFRTLPSWTGMIDAAITVRDITVAGFNLDRRISGGIWISTEGAILLDGVTVTGTPNGSAVGLRGESSIIIRSSEFSHTLRRFEGELTHPPTVSIHGPTSPAATIEDSSFTSTPGDVYSEQFLTSPALRSAGSLNVVGSTFTVTTGDAIVASRRTSDRPPEETVLTVSQSSFNGGVGGGIRASVTTVIEDSTFTGGSVQTERPVVDVKNAPLSIVRSTFDDYDMAWDNTSVVDSGYELHVESSTFARNSTKFGAPLLTTPVEAPLLTTPGDIQAAHQPTTFIVNSTFVDNTTGIGVVAARARTSFTLAHSTFVGNRQADSAGVGSATDLLGDWASGHVVGNVFAPAVGPACKNSYYGPNGNDMQFAGNFYADASCTGSASPGEALLGSLADNGGATLTMAPGRGSALIDGVKPELCVFDVDQRGTSRPQGASCDIGSVEIPFDFIDVTPALTDFYEEITWLADREITTGWDTARGTAFRPFTTITRDAMAAFLYRYAGSPEVDATGPSPFVDVTEDSTDFYEEIVWLSMQDISQGWEVAPGQFEFRPEAPITRDAMAAFLYRYADEPEWTDPPVTPFADLTSTTTEFYTEITWMAGSGITEGWATSQGQEFRPFESTKRDAMAAFLYRYDNLER